MLLEQRRARDFDGDEIKNIANEIASQAVSNRTAFHTAPTLSPAGSEIEGLSFPILPMPVKNQTRGTKTRRTAGSVALLRWVVNVYVICMFLVRAAPPRQEQT